MNCGHSFCGSCLDAIRSNETYTCPQCRRRSGCSTVNYVLKDAVEAVQESQMRGNNMNEKNLVGKSCTHRGFEDIGMLENCDHCKENFCPSCLLGHKVFLRQEIGMIASYVSHSSKLIHLF